MLNRSKTQARFQSLICILNRLHYPKKCQKDQESLQETWVHTVPDPPTSRKNFGGCTNCIKACTLVLILAGQSLSLFTSVELLKRPRDLKKRKEIRNSPRSLFCQARKRVILSLEFLWKIRNSYHPFFVYMSVCLQRCAENPHSSKTGVGKTSRQKTITFSNHIWLTWQSILYSSFLFASARAVHITNTEISNARHV